MFDDLLKWFVIVSLTLFAIGIEVVSKVVRESRFWRWGVIAFGIILSVASYSQIERQKSRSQREQDNIQQKLQTSIAQLKVQLNEEQLAHSSDSQYLRRQLDKLSDLMPAVFKLAEASEENTRKTYQDKAISNKALREFALAVAARMREWDARYRLVQDQNLMNLFVMKARFPMPKPTQEQLQQSWERNRQLDLEESAENLKVENSFLAEFRQNILSDAVFARQQLLVRLGPSEEPDLASPNTTRATVRAVFEGEFYGPDPAGDAATYLELFAKKLRP